MLQKTSIPINTKEKSSPVKAVDSAEFLDQVRKGILSSGKKYLQRLCEDLRIFNNKYDWVGVYVIDGDKLVLDSFSGEKTEHERISIGDGLCSQAVVLNTIVNEPDVKSNSKYLACFANTRSELVVPVTYEGKPVGEIDIDSDTRAAFSGEDEEFITEIAKMLSQTLGALSR